MVSGNMTSLNKMYQNMYERRRRSIDPTTAIGWNAARVLSPSGGAGRHPPSAIRRRQQEALMPELSSLIASILMRLRRGLRLRWQKGVADRWFFCAGHVFFLVIVRASNGWHACQRYIGQDARRGRAGLQPYVRRLWPLLLSKIPYGSTHLKSLARQAMECTI